MWLIYQKSSLNFLIFAGFHTHLGWTSGQTKKDILGHYLDF